MSASSNPPQEGRPLLRALLLLVAVSPGCIGGIHEAPDVEPPSDDAPGMGRVESIRVRETRAFFDRPNETQYLLLTVTATAADRLPFWLDWRAYRLDAGDTYAPADVTQRISPPRPFPSSDGTSAGVVVFKVPDTAQAPYTLTYGSAAYRLPDEPPVGGDWVEPLPRRPGYIPEGFGYAPVDEDGDGEPDRVWLTYLGEDPLPSASVQLSFTRISSHEQVTPAPLSSMPDVWGHGATVKFGVPSLVGTRLSVHVDGYHPPQLHPTGGVIE